MGGAGGVVMEGRDIGTVVFPEADLKIYLDASSGRAGASACERPVACGSRGRGRQRGGGARRARSQRSTRAVSPLMAAADAVVIDTTGVSIDEVVGRVLALVRHRQGADAGA